MAPRPKTRSRLWTYPAPHLPSIISPQLITAFPVLVAATEFIFCMHSILILLNLNGTRRRAEINHPSLRTAKCISRRCCSTKLHFIWSYTGQNVTFESITDFLSDTSVTQKCRMSSKSFLELVYFKYSLISKK